MARSKTKRRSVPRARKKRKSQKSQLARMLAAISILLLLVVGAGVFAHHLFLRETPTQAFRKRARPHHPPSTVPPYEIFPPGDAATTPPVEKPKPPLLPTRVRAAIIIDDIGYDRRMARRFIQLDPTLTLAILPCSTHGKAIAAEAHQNAVDIMLHQPMEPKEYPHINPGPGALFTAMTPDQRIRQLLDNINATPFVIGINNHMGSRMTTDTDQMRQIFSVLKKSKLFFIDSRTTPETLCKASAALLQLPFAERDVFLDHIQDPDFIRKQIGELIRIAEQYGQAIGIAHPHRLTYDVLAARLPELKRRISLVPVHELVHPPI